VNVESETKIITKYGDVLAVVELSTDLWRCVCKCGNVMDSPISLLENGIGVKCRHSTNNRIVSGKDSLDRFYTPANLAVKVVNKLKELIPNYMDRDWVEPSAGIGVFLDIMVSEGIDCIGYDIDPDLKDARVLKQDFLKLEKVSDNSIVLGNPPYGKVSSTAVKFVNHASFIGAEYVAFILPISWSKPTILPRLNKKLHLIHSEEMLGVKYQQPDGSMSRPHDRVFQIWQLKDHKRDDSTKYSPKSNPWISFTTFSDEADIFIRRVGKGIGDLLNINGSINYNTTLYIKVKEPYTKGDVEKAIESMQNELYMDALKTEIIPSLSQVELINRLTEYYDAK